MLHPSKNQSILQWFNSLATKGAVQTLSQFSDGLHFYDIVTTIEALKRGGIPASYVNSPLANDSVRDTVPEIYSKTQDESETDSVHGEKNTEAESSATEMSVDEDVHVDEGCAKELKIDLPAGEKDTDSICNKARDEVEIQKRYNTIEGFIDDFFKMESASLITYSECIKGKELELAKVAVLLLSGMVQMFLSSDNQQVYTTTLLNPQVQEDIKECLSLVLMETSMEDGLLKKAEFHKILSRPSKYKGSPRRRIPSRGNTEVGDTPESPKNVPKKRRERVSILAEEIYESPLKSLLESPKIQFKAAMFKKEAELSKLRNALHAEESKVIDLTLEKRSLNAELEKKKRELEFLKVERRKFIESTEEEETFKKLEKEKLQAEVESHKKVIQNLKEDMENLKKENEILSSEIPKLEDELSHIRATAIEESDKRKSESEISKLTVAIKEDRIKNLEQKVIEVEEEAKMYKEHCEACTVIKSSPKTSPRVSETLQNIFDINDCDEEISFLRKQLTEVSERSIQAEQFLKVAEKDHCKAMHDLEKLQLEYSSLQTEFESSKKQLLIYENWAKSVEKKEFIQNEDGSELTMRPLFSNVWPSNWSEGSERERSVKEEPEAVGKLWDTIETRSRSASALGSYKDSLHITGNSSCSENEFTNIKRLARNIIKVIKKKCDATEAQRLTHLEDQARILSSFKDVCNLFQSIHESLKSLKTATSVSVPELPSKRKSRSQAVEETDTYVINLLSKNKNLETEIESIKQKMSELQEEHTIQLAEKACEIKTAEDTYLKELEIAKNESKDLLEKAQQEATDANKKYEYAKTHIVKLNQENRKLVKACILLKDEAASKEPCKDCKHLRLTLAEIKQDRNDFERDSAELKAIVRDLESKNKNLERQIKNEIKERKRLEFKIERESAFLTGNMSQRNAVIHRYFQRGLSESRKEKHEAKAEGKDDIQKPQQVVSINTYILNHDNNDHRRESCMSNTFANRSIRSGFLPADDEEDFLNHSSLADIHREVFPEPGSEQRLREIRRRNTLCLPHLQSSYPLELQNMTPSERKYYDKLRSPVQPYLKKDDSEEDLDLLKKQQAEFLEIDTEDSQDSQHFTIRKRKGSEVESKKSGPPTKKIMRPSQGRLVQRVKPITPIRRTGFLSKSKSFKTPSSIRRLMRLPQKNKKQ